MPVNTLQRMFNPRGIAVVGASTEPSRPGNQTLQALRHYGYRGGVYPVNPRYDVIGTLPCYPSVESVPAPCDVAVIAVPAAKSAEAVRQCGANDIGIAVVLGGGFRETGPEGLALESGLREAARSANVRLVGPNCLGYVNVPNRVFAGFGSITKPPVLEVGLVSAVLQSGGFGNSIIVQAADAGIGFQNVVTSGNEADIQVSEFIRAFVDDPHTQVILAYIEGVTDGRKLMDAGRYALAAGKPIVTIKGGINAQGLRAAASHTGCMLTPHALYGAAFVQAGIIEAVDICDAIDYLKCLISKRLPEGDQVAVIGPSGGSSVKFCDAAEEFGLKVPPLGPSTLAVLKETLPSFASIDNPIDCTAGFVTDANVGRFQTVLEAVLADPAVHQLGFLAATASGNSYVNQSSATVAAMRNSNKPVICFSAMSDEHAGDGVAIFKSAEVPVIPSPRRAAAAMSMLARYARWQRESRTVRYDPPDRTPVRIDPPSGRYILDEFESKNLIASYGIPVSNDATIPIDTAASLPPGLSYPVAVKVLSPDIPHKSDIGCVALNVLDDAKLEQAVNAVVSRARSASRTSIVNRVLVSEMIPDGLEMIIGAVNDDVFGPTVALGFGGVLAEAIQDNVWRIAPFDTVTANQMIRELRGANVLNGYRNRTERDVESLARALSLVSELCWSIRDQFAELDLNPVMVLARGKGVVVADALIVLKRE